LNKAERSVPGFAGRDGFLTEDLFMDVVLSWHQEVADIRRIPGTLILPVMMKGISNCEGGRRWEV
jgi:hypothetical protein